MAKQDALISIHPVYMASILSGTKTVELRKRIPALEVGVRLWLYSTKPVAALVGTAYVADVESGSPDQIWDNYHEKVGVCRAQFDAYYQDSPIAHGITLTDVKDGTPIDIEGLRRIKPNFHPPQVFVYISNEEAEKFEGLLFNKSISKALR